MLTPLTSLVPVAPLLLLAAAPSIPPNMHPVTPVTGRPGSALGIGTGKFFSYALPEGWRVGEDGQYALTLVAKDNKALTVMVGNAGLPLGYPLGRFAEEKLAAMRPAQLRLGPGRAAGPLPGFAQAVQFEVTYLAAGGVPWKGLATVHVAPAYDSALMVMTAALAAASQWPGYASWLPLVAEQISATSGAAFGRRGLMAQNLRNASSFAEAARQYRDWSQRNWQQVTDERNASVDRQNRQFRENLGGVQSYLNPYDAAKPVELPLTYQHYWIDEKGNVLGTDDPSANPNVGSTSTWKQMPRRDR